MKGNLQMALTNRRLWILIAFCLVSANLGGTTCASDLAAECSAKLQTIPADSIVAKGVGNWMFGRAELHHLSLTTPFWGDKAAEISASQNKAYADPLPAIVRFSDDLKKMGIKLIVVPVPAKAAVYPDMLSGKITREQAKKRLDKFDKDFYQLLREKGVDVLDLTDDFLRVRDDAASQLYCRQDTHWSGRACELAAAAVAKQIKSESWYAAVPKETLATESKGIQIDGDLWIDNKDTALAKEELPFRLVGRKKGGALEPLTADENSPVLLMGDSHVLVFHAGEDMLATQAGLFDQLSFDLGFPIDLLGVRGSGSTTVRISLYRKAKQGDWLQKKKVIVWCFTARDFTESSGGWRIVPVK